MGRPSLFALLILAVGVTACGTLLAQEEDEASNEKGTKAQLDTEAIRREVEKALEDLLDEKAVKHIAEDAAKDEIKKRHSRGVITILGAELEFGGRMELNFVDTQTDRTVAGNTENGSPHLIFDRLRLEPVLDIGRKLAVHAQLDFFAEDDDAFAKEAYLEHDYRHNWWLASRAEIGVDDRFIHLGPTARVSETYALAGTAFWRDEEVGLIWEGTIGRKRGKPLKFKDELTPEEAEEASWYEEREQMTRATPYDAFDFDNNPGALKLHASLGNGYVLREKSVIKDDGDISQIIQDDREVSDDVALRHFGLGVGYERDFNYLGELEVLGFYYEDKLKDESVEFLQQNLTLFDPLTGQPLAGYGLSDSTFSRRMGVLVRYHLEGYWITQRQRTRPQDGLYLMFNYVNSKDGDLDRNAWFAQASYRYSFDSPLIDNTFLRSIEPVIRYGELDLDTDTIATLPVTWDRSELLFGVVVEVTPRVYVKAEYVINDESTGGIGDVDNNELLIQLNLWF